jgi:hypothetical protein
LNLDLSPLSRKRSEMSNQKLCGIIGKGERQTKIRDLFTTRKAAALYVSIIHPEYTDDEELGDDLNLAT